VTELFFVISLRQSPLASTCCGDLLYCHIHNEYCLCGTLTASIVRMCIVLRSVIPLILLLAARIYHGRCAPAEKPVVCVDRMTDVIWKQ